MQIEPTLGNESIDLVSSTRSYVYVFQADTGGAVKIGKADNVHERLKSAQTDNPETLIVAHTLTCASPQQALKVEGLLHRWFSEYHIRGEWFNVTPEDVVKAVKFLLEFMYIVTPDAERWNKLEEVRPTVLIPAPKPSRLKFKNEHAYFCHEMKPYQGLIENGRFREALTLLSKVIDTLNLNNVQLEFNQDSDKVTQDRIVVYMCVKHDLEYLFDCAEVNKDYELALDCNRALIALMRLNDIEFLKTKLTEGEILELQDRAMTSVCNLYVDNPELRAEMEAQIPSLKAFMDDVRQKKKQSQDLSQLPLFASQKPA